MKRRFCVFFTLCFMLLFVIVGSAYGYRHENTIERSFPITPNGLFKLNTVRGDVTVSTHEGNDIIIEAIFGSSDREDLKDAVLNFAVKSYSVIITGNPKLDTSTLAVQYYIKIPEGLKTTSISTCLGKIKAGGHYGDLELSSAGGDITFNGSFTGSRFNSLNGNLELTVRGTLSGPIEATSANGSILLSLADDSSFSIDAATQTGTIRSDFDLKRKPAFVGSKITGTNGDGTHPIKLHAANGDIAVKKR